MKKLFLPPTPPLLESSSCFFSDEGRDSQVSQRGNLACLRESEFAA
jgi:hypothetical protein